MPEKTKMEVVSKQTKAVVQWKGEAITITFNDVKSLICPLATNQETAVFLKTCQSLQLNPFANECYLIKYAEDDKAAFVVAIDSYLKAAELNEQYDGCEAGIILKDAVGALEIREGSFLLDSEKLNLVGAWARVYRKDRGHPTYVAVNKVECIKYTRYGKPTQFWAEEKQPWMLRKTALKRALVEAFPSLFAGTLATAEIAGDIPGEYREIPEGTLPAGLMVNGKPDWRKFWTKVKSELGLTKDQAHELLKVDSIKKDLIDKGWTMERMWNALIAAIQAASKESVDVETGEINTEGEDLFPEETPQESPTETPGSEKPKRDPNSITTISDLMRACFDDFNMQPAAVLSELNVTAASQITQKPSACYQKIAAPRE